MSAFEHIVSVSGGKDSLATYLLALERGRPFRAVGADTDNEDPAWREYLDIIPRITGGPPIEIVKADFAPLFEARRAAIRRDWPKELRRKKHREGCPRKLGCGCPIRISPPVSAARIEAACAALVPTGNAFLDLCMLKGRFPGTKTRFCTEKLKLAPMVEQIKAPLWAAGVSTVEWIGERAQESVARSLKPILQRIREPGGHSGVSTFLYRPIHGWKHEEVFAIAKRHGVPPNPLYMEGFSRVGCMPCINERKKGVRVMARRRPGAVAKLRGWEARVRLVSRRGDATFFCAKMIPGEGDGRAHIDAVVDWSRTGRGGRNYDLMIAADERWADENGVRCDSEYGLCE